MKKDIKGRVGIILSGSSPTDEEKEIIEAAAFNKRTYHNGRFVVCKSGERIVCDFVLNLSGREDIDKYYSDRLLDVNEYLKGIKERLEKAEKLTAPKKEESKPLDQKKDPKNKSKGE